MQHALREAGFTRIDNIREGMAGSAAGRGWIARLAGGGVQDL